MDCHSDGDESEIEETDIDEDDRDIQGAFHSGCASGWTEDEDGVEEEERPHESTHKEILWAAENGDLEVVRKLLMLDTNLTKSKDRDGYSPLHRAAYNNHLDVVELLLEEGADVNAETVDGWTPLHSASHWNSATCAEKFLSLGADVNLKSNGGVTPLHLAASNSQGIETLQSLLIHPTIDVKITNDSHETAYEIALRKSKFAKFFEVVEPCFNFI